MKISEEEKKVTRREQVAGLASYLKNYWHGCEIDGYAKDLHDAHGSPFRAYQGGIISLGKLTELIAASLYDMGWRWYPELRPKEFVGKG